MAKILVLAESGFGKTTSFTNNPELGIFGLNPEETFLISCTNKGLGFSGWKKQYFPAVPEDLTKGNLIMNASRTPELIAKQIANAASRSYIQNVILDDSNYIMQDYYMQKAMTSGYDVFKKIGAIMGGIFLAMENVPAHKNVIMIAHYEEYKNSNLDTISYRYKTVGKMVNLGHYSSNCWKLLRAS